MDIFQIKYQSSAYDKFYEKNKEYLPTVQIYDDAWISNFIAKYDYVDVINSFRTVPLLHYARYKKAFFCDLLRVLILYEFGGVYIDSDVWFTENIINLESYLQKTYGNTSIIFNNGSLPFMYVPQAKNKFITALRNIFISGCAVARDIEMTARLPEDSSINLCRVSEQELSPYFKHILQTTKKKG